MSTLSVCLFGKFRIHRDDQIVNGLNARKVQELFCYLLLHRERSHPRETLAGLLWGDTSTAQSKKFLRQALWQLQSTLDLPSDSPPSRLLVAEPDCVQFNLNADYWLDVREFEQAFTQVEGQRGEQLNAESVQALQAAIDLYSGVLLEGWYQDWCLYERERLHNMYLAMLDKMIDYCETHDQYELGLSFGTRALREDRARERTHRRMMLLHHLAGNRTAALRQYQQCVAALEQELGVRPSRRTTELYEQIRADQTDLAPTSAEAGVPTTVTSYIQRLQIHLKQFHTLLIQIQEEIQTIEQIANNSPPSD